MKFIAAASLLALSLQAFSGTCDLSVKGDLLGNEQLIQKIAKKKGYNIVEGEAPIVVTIVTQTRENTHAHIVVGNGNAQLASVDVKEIGHESFVNMFVDGAKNSSAFGYGKTLPLFYDKNTDGEKSASKSVKRALKKFKSDLVKCKDL